MINVFITDDHQSFSHGLKLFLETVDGIQISGMAANGKQMLQLLPHLKVDVVILDLDMPCMNGEEALLSLKKDFPTIKVLILTSLSDTCVIDKMKKLGANGFRNKEASLQEIAQAITNIHNGYVDYLVKENTSNGMVIVNFNTFHLTGQETKVVRYLSEGLSVKEIASLMNLSDHTVESHCRAARTKANARNTAGLVAQAIKKGLI